MLLPIFTADSLTVLRIPFDQKVIVPDDKAFLVTAAWASGAWNHGGLEGVPRISEMVTRPGGMWVIPVTTTLLRNTAYYQTVVTHPGRSSEVQRENREFELHGFWVHSQATYSKTEVDNLTNQLRAKYEQDVKAIREAIKEASVAALKDASLETLTRAVTDRQFNHLPEQLSEIIRAEVEKVLKEYSLPTIP